MNQENSKQDIKSVLGNDSDEAISEIMDVNDLHQSNNDEDISYWTFFSFNDKRLEVII